MEWTSIAIGSAAVVATVIYVMKNRRTDIKRECGKDYPKDTVILHQFPRGPYAPSMSGFCIKLETFLRMANIPYQNVHAYKTGPKGKSPWIEYNGDVMADSQLIMSFLSDKLEIDLDKTLSKEQRATARAFQKMVDEYTYWSVLLERWVYHRGESCKTITKLPSLVVWEIGRRTKNMAYAHGIGRHTQQEVDLNLEADLTALSDFLGDKKFMFGDEPTEVDCAIFGQVSQVKYHVPDAVKAKQFLKDCVPNLDAYCERMKERFWPDWDECVTNGFTKEATK
ncbi:failed axon connections homolog isoform X1 [Ruditapes philippinarum]|uniref:failed axon connections homolog isoform X1 n=1 Tax=Ruditapes philippinarum TaxID=129788 RepID=UPI00295A5ABC|nr:failed axon connections homolog isoform X1 [Ruditapes philippinarum]